MHLPKLLPFALALAAGSTSAQISISTVGTAVQIDFAAFEGDGFSPNPAAGQLDSRNWSITGLEDGDLDFGGVGDTGDFARGRHDGGVTDGGIYAFDVGDGITGLGVQPTGNDFTPGRIILRLANDTGDALSHLEVSYVVHVYNDQKRSNSFGVGYATDLGSSDPFTAIDSVNVTSPADPDDIPAWTAHHRSASITMAEAVAPGSNLYLSWDGADVSGSYFRDEFALSTISVSAVPEPSIYALIMAVITAGFASWRRRNGRS